MTIRAKTSQEATGRFNENSDMFSPRSLDTQGADLAGWEADNDTEGDTPPAIWAFVALLSGMFWIATIAGFAILLGGE